MLLSTQKATSWAEGNFNEIAEHHWQYGRMKIYQPQQMSSVNTLENLQMRLDLVTPLSIIEDSEEDDQPIKLDQLEELEEVIYGQPYQPDQYSQANITFHGSAPEGSPAERYGEDSD